MEYSQSTSWVANILLLLTLLITMNFPMHSSAARLSRNETDRLALLDFKLQIYDDPYGVMNSWNDSLHHCQWQGVTCNVKHQRVTAITLPGKSLSGTLSPNIGNLSFMKVIHLDENNFHGEIPREYGRLFRLRSLNLSSNILSGEIPVNLSSCSEIRVLSMIKNQLVGKIPSELGSLTKLEILYLAANNLTGEIPSSLGNLSSLDRLSFSFNHLEGNIPEELGLLTNLFFLAMGPNMLTGQIPPSLYNISALVDFTAPDNFLYGSLPTNLALMLPNLLMIGIAGNQFSGEIPGSITNCTKLEVIDFGDNKLQGKVPANLGHLLNLQILSLQGNSLGGNSTDNLDFLVSLTNCSNLQILSLAENKFAGELPNTTGNLSSQLTSLYLAENKISGTIPMGLENLVSLYILDLSGNSFTGVIPSNLGKLQTLQKLLLGRNGLSGHIPSTLCNITNLFALYLSYNNFEGDLTRSLGNCRNLQMLNISGNNFSGILSPQIFGSYVSPAFLVLSSNSLSGIVPVEVGKLTNIQGLDLSDNILSGTIPPAIGDCSIMEFLDMHNNHFNGTIPPTLASLKGIQYLDLSNNNFTGPIPSDLNQLVYLHYLNLSYNDLEGEVPTAGVFGNASHIALAGNNKLCGGLPGLGLPPCSVKRKKKGKHLLITVIPLVFSAIIISIIFVLYLLVHQKGYKLRKGSHTMPSRPPSEKILRVSYHDLYRATEGFSSTNLIGSGGFGFVYKGRLDHHGDKLVAIKVLDIQKSGASKSFKAECKALSNLRHRNLLPVLTYCSSIDSHGHEFKALVYEYMENGNLDMWLHPEVLEATSSRNLNLLQRLNVAIDVASALDYLHNHSKIAVAHCDLKPSNILLDHDLTAHVGDFGLARLLPELAKNSFQQGTSSSTIALKGSIGYAAPEYAMGMEVSTQGDVYSFGILLLEMFTGRRPTDDMFVDGLDLHNHVKMAPPEQGWKIADPSLLSTEEVQAAAEDQENAYIINFNYEPSSKMQESLVSILKIGTGCSQKSPKDRMNINGVSRELHLIRDAYCHF